MNKWHGENSLNLDSKSKGKISATASEWEKDMSKHVKAWHDKHDKQDMSKHVKKESGRNGNHLRENMRETLFLLNLKNVGHHLSKKRKNANNEKYECVWGALMFTDCKADSFLVACLLAFFLG